MMAASACARPDFFGMASLLAGLSGQVDTRPLRLQVCHGDQLVHAALRFALGGVKVGGRALDVLHATTAAEGEVQRQGSGDWQHVPLNIAEAHLETSGLRQPAAVLETVATLLAGAFRTVSLFSRLRSLAHYDQLCQLPNRPLFITMLDAALQSGRDWVVAVVDIDHFSSVSHALGDRLGDALLQAVAERLKQALSDRGAELARIHTDNFAILIPRGSFSASEIQGLFADPLSVDHYQLPVSLTAGMVDASEIAGGGETLLKCASTALKLAKQQARGACRSFEPAMADEIEQRVRLLHDLKAALAKGQLEVHYQPQVSLADGRPVGVEALLRWQHPQRGMIPPDVFIGLAERSGLIVDLGEFVLARACRDFAVWQAAGLPVSRVGVNVSIAQFKSPRFLPAVLEALRENGLAAQALELEITESMLMSDPLGVVGNLNALKSMGVTVALDDFGTGFSSLSYLRTLPIDRLKVDRSFVRDIDSGEQGAKIAEMVVSLGKTLGMQIIAEGIEREVEATALAGLGCHEGQGYLYARPMSAAALADWLRQY